MSEGIDLAWMAKRYRTSEEEDDHLASLHGRRTKTKRTFTWCEPPEVRALIDELPHSREANKTVVKGKMMNQLTERVRRICKRIDRKVSCPKPFRDYHGSMFALALMLYRTDSTRFDEEPINPL